VKGRRILPSRHGTFMPQHMQLGSLAGPPIVHGLAVMLAAGTVSAEIVR